MMLRCSPAGFPLAVLVLLGALAGLPGCANVPYIAGEAVGVRERADLQTGSNLVRRDKGGTGAREVDKDALESTMRGTNANRDNGR